MVDLGKNLLVLFSIAFQHEEELCCNRAPRKTERLVFDGAGTVKLLHHPKSARIACARISLHCQP